MRTPGTLQGSPPGSPGPPAGACQSGEPGLATGRSLCLLRSLGALHSPGEPPFQVHPSIALHCHHWPGPGAGPGFASS